MITKNDAKLNRKSHQCKVVSYNATTGVYRIWSPSGSTYTVNLNGSIIGCTCRWGRRGGAGCAHERCARRHWAALHEGRAVSFLSGQPNEVARKQHKAVKPVAKSGNAALTMVLRDRDPLHEVSRLAKAWGNADAMDLFFEQPDGTDRHERVEGANFAALVAKARKAGWQEIGLYWWRE